MSAEPLAVAAPGAQVHVTGPRPPAAAEILRRAWEERSLLGYFGRRFNEKRYLRTRLGTWWLLLRPGFTVGWQMFVFILVAPVDTGPVPFAITFLLAFATWTYFAEAAYWATRSLELNRRPLKVIAVSPLVVIAAAIVPAIVDLAICACFLLLTVVGYLVVDGQSHLVLSAGSVSVVAGYVLLSALALAVGLLLAVPGMRYRDVRFGLRFALSTWYFATPVIYAVSSLPAGARTVVELNPVTAGIEFVRHGLLGTPGPSALALASSVLLTSAGLVLGFRRFVGGHGKGLDHL